MQQPFTVTDRVIHALKPEWGVGRVMSVESLMQNGQPAQRVTIRFDRAGLKTLSTHYAELRRADSAAPIDGSETARTWLEELERQDPREVMSRLPEAATDPFRSLESRIAATLALYRFSGQSASLIDWAAVQSGLSDPLARFNRQELEQFFRSFEIERDAHLRRTFLEARKTDPGMLPRMLESAPPAAKSAMRRLDASR